VKLSALRRHAARLSASRICSTSQPVHPGRLAASQRPLYNFLLNKWYFDEAYDFLFVRSAKALGRFLWKGATGR
jgi:NADH-quinone oxidoreductase subunit L